MNCPTNMNLQDRLPSYFLFSGDEHLLKDKESILCKGPHTGVDSHIVSLIYKLRFPHYHFHCKHIFCFHPDPLYLKIRICLLLDSCFPLRCAIP